MDIYYCCGLPDWKLFKGMLEASLVTAVAYQVAWGHLSSGHTLQMEDKRYLGISVQPIQGFLRQIFVYRDLPKSLLNLLSSLGFGSGLSTIDLIQPHALILHLFPQFLYPAENNNSHFPLIQASCAIKVIVDSCLPSSPCSDCCQITPSARYTQTWGWSFVPWEPWSLSLSKSPLHLLSVVSPPPGCTSVWTPLPCPCHPYSQPNKLK